MSDKHDDPYHLKQYMEFDESDPRFQVKMLGMRVDVLTKEKEDIEDVVRELKKEVAGIQKTFQRGAGAMIVLPIIGTLIGLLFAYGKIIFAPWIGK